MSTQESAGESLIVTTNKGDYYVIPAAALEQFRATPEEQQEIDEETVEEVGTGFYSGATAAERSRQSDFASEDKTTARAIFEESENGSLIVSTNKGDYYAIPAAALEQFRAAPEQQQEIDEEAREEVGTGFYSGATAAETSRQASFASEDKTTARARFDTI